MMYMMMYILSAWFHSSYIHICPSEGRFETPTTRDLVGPYIDEVIEGRFNATHVDGHAPIDAKKDCLLKTANAIVKVVISFEAVW
jgi:hypothetical protein